MSEMTIDHAPVREITPASASSLRMMISVAIASMASAAMASPVYIPLGDAGSVVIVDSVRDRITGRIDGVPHVHGLAATPDGRFLVAGSMEERAAGAARPEKPGAVSEEDHAAHHPQPGVQAVPTASEVSTVSVIDTQAGSVIRRIDVPGAVHHVAIDPRGRLAVVTHPGLGGITVIDLSSFEVRATVLTGPFANYAAFSPDGGRLYVSNTGNDTVSEIDVERWIVRRNVVVDDTPEHLVLASEGARLYVNNVNAGTVSVIETQSFDVVETLEAGMPLHGIDLAEDGETLFVAVLGEDRLAAFDLGSAAIREVRLSPGPYHVAAIPGTEKLYVSSNAEPKLWVLDQETLAVRGEIEIDGKGHQMVPTGER